MIHSMTHRRRDEIWVDGPLADRSSKVKLRAKPMPPLASSSPHCLDDAMETESVVSSHCHLPVLPVFKDHSLLPFRSNQTRPLSPNQVNDDMEFLEKTLETLLVPTSSTLIMSPDEKNKRLSRIVSPTRFDQLLM